MVGGEQVGAVVPDDRRRSGDGVEGPLQAWPHRPVVPVAAARPPSGTGAVGGLGEVEQVSTFGIVELEGARDRVEDRGRDAAEGTAFELCVVLNTHPSEGRDLAAAARRHGAALLEVSGPARE
jgi:hypothetical protein